MLNALTRCFIALLSLAALPRGMAQRAPAPLQVPNVRSPGTTTTGTPAPTTRAPAPPKPAAQAPVASAPVTPGRVSAKATGILEMKMIPQVPQPKPGDTGPAHFTLEKQYHGELEGSGAGEVLVASTTVSSSVGYVAIERFTGKLAGRTGSFLLQHSAIMNRGVGNLSVVIVPDSASGELAGLAGTMTVKPAKGGQTYVLDYSLPVKN